MTIEDFFGWLVGRTEAKDEEPDEAPEEPKPAEDPSAAARTAIQKIRADLTAFGTAIGVGSTVAIGTSAVVTFDSMFPLPSPWGWVALALTLFVAVGSSVLLTRLFFSAKRRILINTMDFKIGARRPDERPGEGLSEAEEEEVGLRFAEFADEEGLSNVTLVEARAERLARVATIAAADGRADVEKYATAESKRLLDGLHATMGQAALLVIERRSALVYHRKLTAGLAIAAALGTAGIFVVASWSKGEEERLTTWVTCQKDFVEDVAGRTGVCGADPRLNPSQATASLSLPSEPTGFGMPVHVSVTVPQATGRVELLDGGVVVSEADANNGAASFDVTTLASGSHTISARYTPDSKTLAATTAAKVIVVNKAKTPSVKVLTTSFRKGTKPTVEVFVSPLDNHRTPVGRVRVYVNGRGVKKTALPESLGGSISIWLPKEYSTSITVEAKFIPKDLSNVLTARSAPIQVAAA